jgi:hypothetical protein
MALHCLRLMQFFFYFFIKTSLSQDSDDFGGLSFAKGAAIGDS